MFKLATAASIALVLLFSSPATPTQAAEAIALQVGCVDRDFNLLHLFDVRWTPRDIRFDIMECRLLWGGHPIVVPSR